ncbi:c-type cytochrome [Synoicihabitans lomoniglobus]|uniref:Cytochrome c n=1 Tax=Synoicihabitans lomoniglobus TaxID=2909285 RepID=A0AAF0I4G8_9BACT|nr:cytochrome c [Opitutaceae bacterium LMO-M01]WED66480.1 cytochrome c [Opitutaceae bacterium LMO-M01]
MSDEEIKKSDPTIEQGAASDEQIQEVHSVLLREKREPSEGYTPMPLFLLGFVSSMIFIVSIYFIHYRGGLTEGIGEAAMIYDERFDPKLHGGAANVVKEVDPMVAGKKVYTQVCATCHQVTGSGVPGVYPPLAGSDWVSGSEERLINILVHGLAGPVEVAGTTYNGNMPAFGKGSAYNWGDDRISYVLTYIRAEFGGGAAPVTVERVTELREGSSRTTQFSAEELLALP